MEKIVYLGYLVSPEEANIASGASVAGNKMQWNIVKNLALEEDVEVSVTGCLTQEIAISDVELCTIFSNLIKNSVEELKKNGEGKKYLKIKVSSGQQAFKIEISNSIPLTGSKHFVSTSPCSVFS
mgnify:CR=1 FL=1